MIECIGSPSVRTTPMHRIRAKFLSAATISALLSACAALPTPLDIGALGTSRTVVGSASELYTRIARGALSCWFGASGTLKEGYVYHAEAEPPSRGGASEITVHVRETQGDRPRGVRAFRVAIKPKGDSAELETTIHKIPEPLGNVLKADVDRWAAGEIGCRADAPGADWTPNDPNTPQPAAPKPSGKSKKAAGKKT